MSETRTSHKVYAAWDYEKEIEELNEQSRQGWQLVKGGCFYSRYEKNPAVVNRYQIDFNQKVGDKERYIDMFEEQGWKYINSTFNGWHYFEKAYDSSLPEEEYQIYTDRPSKTEMANRWIRIAVPLFVIVSLYFVFFLTRIIREPAMAYWGLLVEFACAIYLMGAGIVDMRKVIRGEEDKNGKKSPVGAVFTVIILGFLWYTVFGIIL